MSTRELMALALAAGARLTLAGPATGPHPGDVVRLEDDDGHKERRVSFPVDEAARSAYIGNGRYDREKWRGRLTSRMPVTTSRPPMTKLVRSCSPSSQTPSNTPSNGVRKVSTPSCEAR